MRCQASRRVSARPRLPGNVRIGRSQQGPSEGRALWAVATDEPQLLSQLAEAAQLTVSEASLQATLLELDGWLRAAPGGRYARARPG